MMCIYDPSVCCEDYVSDDLVDSDFLSCEDCVVYFSVSSEE